MRPAGSRSAAAAPLSLAGCSRARVAEALGADGLWLDLGAATLRVRSDSPEFAAQLQRVYGAFPFVDVASWADVHVDIERVGGLRRWWRPQVRLRSDGRVQFEPFPADSPLPLFEWGCNWLMAQRLNDLLLLHAGTLERDGLALLLPALPGSGKSTLTAALSSRGWRLLSDEFGVFDPNDGALHALVKPVGLKNHSIDVIRSFAPQAVMGPSFPKTRKGTVAHLAPPADAVARRCAVRGWENWIEPLCEWLQDFLRLPLDGTGGSPFTLAEVSTWVAEMEFWIAVHGVDLARLDALVCRHTLAAAPRPALQPGQLNGMLKGFIDLVAEHEGRYYVVDYKSNWLGPDDAAYSAEAMAREILAHRYELQYVLYLLALHRLLKLRLPDYDYDRHVGGALYLFLRGSHGAGGGVHAERPPRALIEALDRLFARSATREAA